MKEILVCIKGFTSFGSNIKDSLYGGSAYMEDSIISVEGEFDNINLTKVYWPLERINGIYARALRKATSKEIDAFNRGLRTTTKQLSSIEDEIIEDYQIF